MKKPLRWITLDFLPFTDFLEKQDEYWENRLTRNIPDTVLFATHPHAYSIGSKPIDQQFCHLFMNKTELDALNIPLLRVRRGGDITYHGPGVLGAYTICRVEIQDAQTFVHNLEKVIVETLEAYGLKGERYQKVRDVWVGNQKIAAVGIHISRGIARFGFNLNVDPDLSYFDYIAPCGVEDCANTSIAKMIGRRMEWDEPIMHILVAFEKIFGYKVMSPNA